jgi:hypothetical protein
VDQPQVPLGGIASEDRRRVAAVRQTRLPEGPIFHRHEPQKVRDNPVQKRFRCDFALAVSALTLVLSVTTLSAQQPLPTLPTPALPRPVPPILQNYKPVMQELTQPRDDDWLMYRRTYNGWGYSPLSQIPPKTYTV